MAIMVKHKSVHRHLYCELRTKLGDQLGNSFNDVFWWQLEEQLEYPIWHQLENSLESELWSELMGSNCHKTFVRINNVALTSGLTITGTTCVRNYD
jgi:hypothetical protein